MRDIIVYALIVLLCKVESWTLCDDKKCVCVNKEKYLHVSCFSNPAVIENDYDIPNNLTTLNLSSNNITRIQRSFVSESLLELFLTSNRIEEIAVEAFQLPSLKILDLSHNNLQNIHRDVFLHLKILEYLNLANNKFSTFGALNFYHLKSLQYIVLDDNTLGATFENYSLFEGGYELTNKIISISLKNVQLNNNKNLFSYAFRSLKKLNLAQNNLTEIFDLPLNLEYLDLSNNPIKTISRDDFFDVVYLNELKLNNILIREVRNFAFHYLTSLRHLELEGNLHLRKFSPLAWGDIIMKDQIDLLVESMTLRGSNLTTLDQRLEGIFKKIRRVDLRNNPWKCDCKLAWLQNVLIPKELADFRCSTPQNLLNRTVLELKPSEFICEETNTGSSEGYLSVIGIIAYCILLASAILMMYFFIFSPKPYIYRQLPIEFPSTP